jgi:KaiC/GvpD/RAD55 family RecA-like ATPase
LNVGNEIVSSVLETGELKYLIDAGFKRSWIDGEGTGSEVIFSGEDRRAYLWLLKYHSRHGVVPPVSLFREEFSRGSYPLSTEVIPVDELAVTAERKVSSFLITDILNRTIDLHQANEIEKAAEYLATESPKLTHGISTRTVGAFDLTGRNFDIDEFLDHKLERGIPFGIKPVDEAFYGFQEGHLITLLGRQKAGKTTFTLNSAVKAWEAGYKVLFISVEMGESTLRQRFYAIGANVSSSKMRRGHLNDKEKEKVREFHYRAVEPETAHDEGTFFLSRRHSLLTIHDIRDEIKKADPHIVYIDGFGFLKDISTGKTTNDWQANENMAYELKTLAEELGIVIFVNTQVQEKQYHKEIDISTIAGGTGLNKASDLMINLDYKEGYHIITCGLTRYEGFGRVTVDLNWEDMTFNIMDYEDDIKKKEDRASSIESMVESGV